MGVEAPAWQGARSAHTGSMQATSNAARRDASASRVAQLFVDGSLAERTPRATFGIAFEGCGCRAAFQVGVIEWFTEHNLLPAAVAGASSGSLIAAATAIGGVAELRPVWTELFGSRVRDMGRLLRGRWPFR